MKLKLTIIYLWIISFTLFAPAAGVSGHQTSELINQLTGKSEAPQRDATQLTQAYQKAIDYLLPLMSAEDVGSRYAPQITLQQIAFHASRPGAETERMAMAMVILKTLEQAEMPDTVRHWLVLQLERIGQSESVPALTKLLSAEDKHLRDFARRALEKNTDPSATQTLLKELANAKEPEWKIGLINSLGQRKAESAVQPIAKALNDSDIKVASAAATALTNIADKDSVQALLTIIENPAAPIYQKAAQGLIDIAGQMAEEKNTAAAAKIYEALYENAAKPAGDSDSPNPFNIRAAAVIGLIVCDPEKGTRELLAIMQNADQKTRTLTIRAARLSPNMEAVRTLGKMLAELPPYSQVQVLGVIGDRGDRSSINYVKELLRTEDPAVRLAAIDALTMLADSAAAESLFDIAVNGFGYAKRAALAGLAIMKGPDVEVLIKANSLSGDVQSRVTAIDLLGQRHVSDSVKSLLILAAEQNEDINAAAFAALENFADSLDIATILDLLVRTKSGKARYSGIVTFRAMLSKARDKDAAAKIIIEKTENADSQTKLLLLGTLDALGGSRALKAVAEAAKSSDENTCNIGIRTLSNWPDYEAAKILLEIVSKPETSLTHYVLATRGVLQLIQTSETTPLEVRASDCINAFDNARRDEEKRQAISTMALLPAKKVADKLMELVKDEKFKEEAALAAVQLSAVMLTTDRQAARELAQKIREMNISDDINRRAESVISGRGFRFREGRSRRNR
ncbi:MAG: HEAT repeat domain-containing protein [Sedimentisphaerales bacterium]|nr:HEAT repeat domain-containing protein [Sedimentisphaerales bacterium]